MLKIFISFALGAVLSGCLACSISTTQPLLTPDEVLSRTKATDSKPLTLRIAALWQDIERGRRVIAYGFLAGYDKTTLNDFYFQLEVCDYYMTRAWALMIESNDAGAIDATVMGEAEMTKLKDLALEIFKDLPKEPEAEKQSS